VSTPCQPAPNDASGNQTQARDVTHDGPTVTRSDADVDAQNGTHIRFGKTGLIEVVVADPNGGDDYLYGFSAEVHLELTKLMVRSVAKRIKDRRSHTAWIRIMERLQRLDVEDLQPWPQPPPGCGGGA
jgi:hypothetical protein